MDIARDNVERSTFVRKKPEELSLPKSDPITVAQLAECNGTDPSKPTLVAIKGTVFDVTGNPAYEPRNGSYRAFAGKDASRALAKSSVKPEDCRPDWEDLDEKEKKTLDQWVTFFTKRYNIVGKVVGG